MDAWEYSYIQREVLELTGVDLRHYKPEQVQRRLAAYLLRSGHATWRSLFQAIRTAPRGGAELKSYLTINVSAFFRDSEPYAYLRAQIVPQLLRRRPMLRVWSAGCACGQEAYSLAMILAAQCPPGQGYRILATDLDQAALQIARAGGPYAPNDVASIPPQVAHYLEARAGGYWAGEALRRHINFQQQNLLSDPVAGPFDLIVCRNVTIYLTRAAQAQLYRRFHACLRPGGILFVGATEVIARPAQIGFEPIAVSFYRKQAEPQEQGAWMAAGT